MRMTPELHIVQKNLVSIGGWKTKAIALKHLKKALEGSTDDDVIGWMTPDIWIDTSDMTAEELWAEATA